MNLHIFWVIFIRKEAMQLIDPKLMNQQIQSLITNKVEQQCFLCLGQYNHIQYAPMIICSNLHSCCAPCMKELLRNQAAKSTCPHCNQPINKKMVTKNRYLLTIFELVDAYKRYVKEIMHELESLRNVTNISSNTSLLSKHSKMENSVTFTQIPHYWNKQLSLFDEMPISQSQSWLGSSEIRRENLLSYAQREKIDQLIKIAKNDIPLDQVTKIRSGYGSIKKIECMEYFVNLKQLLLYNNQIKVIEGLNKNHKLNVLALGYNKIQKIQNIGHLKNLKRLAVECNKIGKSSAQYLSIYQWKNLESLTISFHEGKNEENQECFGLLFSGKNSSQWAAIKTLYVYNSSKISQKTRQFVKNFAGKRKTPFQVYWS